MQEKIMRGPCLWVSETTLSINKGVLQMKKTRRGDLPDRAYRGLKSVDS